MPKYLLIFIIFFVVVGSFLPLGTAEAFSLIGEGSGVSPACYNQGDCSVCDALRVVYNVGNLVMMLVGGVALILMIIAGLMFIVNAGNTDRVSQAKKLMVNTVIAIVIVLAAYAIVHFVAVGVLGSDVKWATGPECG